MKMDRTRMRRSTNRDVEEEWAELGTGRKTGNETAWAGVEEPAIGARKGPRKNIWNETPAPQQRR
jgi:hypothetical protein